MKHLGSEILFSVPPCWCSRKLARATGLVSRDPSTLAGAYWQSSCPGRRILGFRGPGTRNSFYKASCLGRGQDRVPLGAGRRAASASCSPEGNTLPSMRRNGSSPQPPCGRSATCRSVCIPPSGLLPPLGDHSAPAPLTESPEPACADWTTLGYLTLKHSCQFFLLLPFST